MGLLFEYNLALWEILTKSRKLSEILLQFIDFNQK